MNNIYPLQLSWGANHRLHLRQKLLEDQHTRLAINDALENLYPETTRGRNDTTTNNR